MGKLTLLAKMALHNLKDLNQVLLNSNNMDGKKLITLYGNQHYILVEMKELHQV